MSVETPTPNLIDLIRIWLKEEDIGCTFCHEEIHDNHIFIVAGLTKHELALVFFDRVILPKDGGSWDEENPIRPEDPNFFWKLRKALTSKENDTKSN